MFSYPAVAHFDEESETYEITYRDFDNIHAVAYTEDDIELEASDILHVGLEEFVASKLPIPTPSKAQVGDFIVYLPLISCLKIALHNAMLETKTKKSDLARKMNLTSSQIECLLGINQTSKVDSLEQALYLLGYSISISVNKDINQQ
jgi:antitoxin HicB